MISKIKKAFNAGKLTWIQRDFRSKPQFTGRAGEAKTKPP